MERDIVHTSVLKNEVLQYLAPDNRDDNILFIDSTLGEGGHSFSLLDTFPNLQLIGLDADSTIMSVAKERLAKFAKRVSFYNTWFNQFYKAYPEDISRPDRILFDLGISVYHYERGNRGFSFSKAEALDMRLGGELETSAEDIINEYPEDELADLIYEYGEERYSRRIAKAICDARNVDRITTADKLAFIIKGSVPKQYRYGRIHPATRTFQAIRIAVNGELTRLDSALEAAFAVLKPGGKMGVISFHSLEDRRVKHFFKEKAKVCHCPPDALRCTCDRQPYAKIETKKPVVPTEEEVAQNSPSRSAKLRVITKIRDEE